MRIRWVSALMLCASLTACGGNDTKEVDCEASMQYQNRVEGKRIVAPEGLDALSEMNERAGQAAAAGLDSLTYQHLSVFVDQFAQEHPEIELRFSASLRIMDLNRDGIDVAPVYRSQGIHDYRP